MHVITRAARQPDVLCLWFKVQVGTSLGSSKHPFEALWRTGCGLIRNCGAVAQFQRQSGAAVMVCGGLIPLCRRATVVDDVERARDLWRAYVTPSS